MGVDVVGVERDGRAVRGYGVREVALLMQHHAEVVVHVGVLGLELDRAACRATECGRSSKRGVGGDGWVVGVVVGVVATVGAGSGRSLRWSARATRRDVT